MERDQTADMVLIPPRGGDRQAAQEEDEAVNLDIRDEGHIANPEQTGSNVIVIFVNM